MKYQTTAKRVSASLRRQGLKTALRDYPTGLFVGGSGGINNAFMMVEVRDPNDHHLGYVYVYANNQIEVDCDADPALCELVKPL